MTPPSDGLMDTCGSQTIYFGARYYHPKLGRFTTPDPLFVAEPERCEKSVLECNLRLDSLLFQIVERARAVGAHEDVVRPEMILEVIKPAILVRAASMIEAHQALVADEDEALGASRLFGVRSDGIE